MVLLYPLTHVIRIRIRDFKNGDPDRDRIETIGKEFGKRIFEEK